jgi:Mg2+/Co2+ transporter CorB
MISLILLFAIVTPLLMISAFFSAAETAITAASKAKLHQLSKDGDERATIIKHLQNNLGLVISAFLMGNTLFNTLSVSVATALLIQIVGQEGVAYASLLMGALIIIYAEVTPKICAVQNAEKFLLKSARAINFLFKFLQPLLKTINIIARISVRPFGIKTSLNADSHATVEELRGVIDLHHGPGSDVAEERAMLKSILDLGSVQVDEIMIHRKNVTMINIEQPASKIVDQVLESPFTRIPLWQENSDNIVGVIHAKALLRAVKSQPELDKLEILSVAAKPWFIPESTDLLEQLKAFRERREHFAIVVDEYGSLLGIVTLEDILEEIVGDISDEHDINVKGVRPQVDGSYIIDGSVTIRDLNRQFDWNLPDAEASTIAGLILYKVRRITDVGQVFMLCGFRFEILRRQRNQITLIRVTPPSRNGLSSGR